MSPIEKYGSIKIVRNEGKAREHWNDLARQSPYEIEQFYFSSPNAGKGFLKHFKIDDQPAILEVIVSDDVMNTIYVPHPIFNSRDDLIQSRREIIEIIEDMKESAPGRLVVNCSVRKRPAHLKELSTIQLVELFAVLTFSMSK